MTNGLQPLVSLPGVAATARGLTVNTFTKLAVCFGLLLAIPCVAQK